MEKKNVAYIRTLNDDENAVEFQKDRVMAFAMTNNIKIDDFYVDNGYSTSVNRPSFNRLLKNIKNGKIQELYFTDVDRLNRDSNKLLDFIHIGLKNNVKMHDIYNTDINQMYNVLYAARLDMFKKKLVSVSSKD